MKIEEAYLEGWNACNDWYEHDKVHFFANIDDEELYAFYEEGWDDCVDGVFDPPINSAD